MASEAFNSNGRLESAKATNDMKKIAVEYNAAVMNSKTSDVGFPVNTTFITANSILAHLRAWQEVIAFLAN